jgi:hypothetical protein
MWRGGPFDRTPSARRSSFPSKLAWTSRGPNRPRRRRARAFGPAGARGANGVPSRTDYLSVCPGPYCTTWLRSNAPAVCACQLMWREIHSPAVRPRARDGDPAARISNARAARALCRAARHGLSRRFSKISRLARVAPKVRTKSAENLARCGRNAVASCCPGYAL